MFSMNDAAELIVSLNIVGRDHVWIGKLQDKVSESVGVYPLKRSGKTRIPIGGLENTDHDTKRISILIHWNRDMVVAEEVAANFYAQIRDMQNVTINEQRILYISMLVPEAVYVGTDDYGVHEYVIEAEIIHERK